MNNKFNAIKLVSGQCLTQILDRALLVAMIWFVVQHHNKVDVAIFLGIATIPYFFAVGISSIVINKFGALRVVYLADFLRACWFLAVYITLSHSYSAVELSIVLFVSNCLASLFDPAILSLPPLIMSKSKVHKLTAMLNSCVSIGAIIGPAAAILVTHGLGLRNLFLFVSFSYLIAGALELTIKIEHRPEGIESGIANKVKGYMNLISNIDFRIYFFLFIGILQNLLIAPLQVFLPIYIHRIMNLGMVSYTHLQIAMGIGAIMGALLVSFFSRLSERLSLVLAAAFYLLSTCFYILFSMGISFNSSMFSVFGMDFFMSAGNVIVLSLYQQLAPKNQLPFIMSCVMFISVAVAPLAMLFAGFAISNYSIMPIVEFYSSLSFMLMLIALCLVLIMINAKTILKWAAVRTL